MPKGGARLLLAVSLCALAGAARSGETISYGYDSLGRLIRVERIGTVNNSVNVNYSYDAAGNRTSVTVNAPAGTGTPAVAGGGFEEPEVGAGFAYGPAGGQATFASGSGVAGNGSAWGFASAPEGDQVAFIQAGGAASSVSLPVTGLTPGASYRFRFRIAARPNYGPNPVTVAMNGLSLGTFTPDSNAFTAVASAAFTASASSGTLTFTGSASPADLATGLDLVTIEAAGPPPPPAVAGGGFEAPEVGAGFAYGATGGPAVFTGGSGVAGNGSAWGFASAPEGDQVAFIQTGTGSSVSLPVTGLTPGASYRFRFRIAARPSYGALPVTVSLDGIALGTFTPDSNAFTAFATPAFIAPAGSGTLTFRGSASATDLGTGLDLVTVETTATATSSNSGFREHDTYS